ncbi:MAG TPA: T9SS type A sorting domain-containing protein, partial [Bacteroidales bacterium]|nr:T9SS type A sorting domain-containing protein [Bacteroidales bacterium]
QDFSYRQCNDFEPGDVFHYLHSQYNGIITIREIRTILDKTVYGNDSVAYTIERCSHKIIAAPPAPVYQNVWDTVTQVISGNNTIFTAIPEQFIPVTNWGFRAANQYIKPSETFNGREEKTVVISGYYFPDSCWTGWNGTVDTYSVIKETYSRGLGRTYYFFDSWDGSNSHQDYTNLVYYKKGEEEWGIPLAASCTLIVPVNEKVNTPRVTIFPGPVVSSATLNIRGTQEKEQFTLALLDISGRVMKEYSFSGSSFHFDRNNLSSGIYFVRISGNSGNIVQTVRVVFL